MESEGKKVRSGGGGFGGTGFKFDEIEAQYTTEKKKYQKAAFGLQVRVKLKIKRKERKFDEIEAQYTTVKKKYQKAAFGLQVRVKLKIKRKEINFDKIEAQYTTEKKKYQKGGVWTPGWIREKKEKRKMSLTVRGGLWV
jgi:hypothetical protein